MPTRRALLAAPAALAFDRLFGHGALAAAPAIPPGAPAPSKRVLQNLARLDARLAQRPVGYSYTAFPAGYTFAGLWPIEAPFDKVRFHFTNGATTAGTIIGSFAVSSAANDGYTPVGGTWTNMTFNAAGSEAAPGYPMETAGATTTFTVPAGTSSPDVPSLSASDWMPIEALAPTDGTLSWLMARIYVSGAFNGPYINNFAAWKSSMGQRCIRSFIKQADAVTTPSNMGGASEGGYIAPAAVEYIARAPGASVLVVGDSITAGAGSASGLTGWGTLACLQLSKPSLPVTYLNAAKAGQASANFFLNGKAAIDAFAPKVVVISPFTPNDTGPTQASIDTGWGNAMALAQYAIARGAVPVLFTPIPWGYAAGPEALRQQVCARVRAYGAGGGLVVDMDAVIRDPASTANGLAAYIAGALSPHPNDLGNAAMAAATLPVLSQAIGLS